MSDPHLVPTAELQASLRPWARNRRGGCTAAPTCSSPARPWHRLWEVCASILARGALDRLPTHHTEVLGEFTINRKIRPRRQRWQQKVSFITNEADWSMWLSSCSQKPSQLVSSG